MPSNWYRIFEYADITLGTLLVVFTLRVLKRIYMSLREKLAVTQQHVAKRIFTEWLLRAIGNTISLLLMWVIFLATVSKFFLHLFSHVPQLGLWIITANLICLTAAAYLELSWIHYIEKLPPEKTDDNPPSA